MKSFGMFLGRLCLAAIFILAAIGKVKDWDMTVQYMASKSMTMIPLFLTLAIIVEFFGGVSLALGFKTRTAAILLLLFLIPVTAIFHDFWNVGAAEQPLQLIMFLKNLAIFGGLIYVASCGSGRCSVDGVCCKKVPVEE